MESGASDHLTGGPPRIPEPSFAPPRFTDPRRLGAVVGLVGAFVFVHAYAPLLGDHASWLAAAGGYLLVAAALVRLLGRPAWLGTFVVPRPGAIATYLACVVGELGLLRLGSLWLTDAGREEARPALIAAVVGLHFIPFAWAFGERMFSWLGATLLVLGAFGLAAELVVDVRAAPWAAVASGWAMAVLLLGYASGVFARPRVRPGESSRPDERGS
jgi:hypothetical protein